MKQIANIIALFTTVAIVAVLATKPAIVTDFFSGTKGLLGTALGNANK